MLGYCHSTRAITSDSSPFSSRCVIPVAYRGDDDVEAMWGRRFLAGKVFARPAVVAGLILEGSERIGCFCVGGWRAVAQMCVLFSGGVMYLMLSCARVRVAYGSGLEGSR